MKAPFDGLLVGCGLKDSKWITEDHQPQKIKDEFGRTARRENAPVRGILYKIDGDARREIQIKSLREWVWLMLELTPKRDFCVVSVRAFFVNFLMHSPKRYLNGLIIMVTFIPNTLCETKNCKLHPKPRRRAPRHFYNESTPPETRHFPIFDSGSNRLLIWRENGEKGMGHNVPFILSTIVVTLACIADPNVKSPILRAGRGPYVNKF